MNLFDWVRAGYILGLAGVVAFGLFVSPRDTDLAAARGAAVTSSSTRAMSSLASHRPAVASPEVSEVANLGEAVVVAPRTAEMGYMVVIAKRQPDSNVRLANDRKAAKATKPTG